MIAIININNQKAQMGAVVLSSGKTAKETWTAAPELRTAEQCPSLGCAPSTSVQRGKVLGWRS